MPPTGRHTASKAMMTRESVLSILREELPYLQERFGVKKLMLFGSFAKGSFSAHSDVDLLVDFSRPIGLEFVTLADYLEKILGRKVHLITLTTLHHNLSDPYHRPIAEDIVRTMTDV